MDPPPATTTTAAAAAAAVEQPHSHSLPPLPTTKIRLMCSYGGHIVPRPQTKSLCYAGGETRIVAVDRRTTASTISSLTHHLSRTLFGNRPFTLKYQLPNEDLDSLVTITTDEDLQNMLEEHDRIASSPTPSRIRLFLFPARPESVGSLLLDPKSESWFSDALKGTMIINRGLSDGSGMGNGLMGLECLEGNGESLMNSGDSGKCGGGGDSGSVPESLVLETCSSFGSINSSASASNSIPIGVNHEDGGGGILMEKKVKVAATASIESDNPARVYQDKMLPESESIIYNPSLPVQMPKNIQPSGYHIPVPDQIQQPAVQYIHSTPPHYFQYPTGTPLPISSYYPMYVPYQQPPPLPHQPYPVYVLPVAPTEHSSNISPPTHVVTSHVGYKEVREVRLPQPPAEQAAVAPQPAPSKPVGPTVIHTPSYENEYDNDLVYAQIYKSQPSAPTFPHQKFETVKKAEQVQLSDSLAQLSIETPQQ